MKIQKQFFKGGGVGSGGFRGGGGSGGGVSVGGGCRVGGGQGGCERKVGGRG